MKLGPTLAIGTRGRKRGVVLTDPAELNELRERLASLTPEQREDLRLLAHQQVLNSVKTKVGSGAVAFIQVWMLATTRRVYGRLGDEGSEWEGRDRSARQQGGGCHGGSH